MAHYDICFACNKRYLPHNHQPVKGLCSHCYSVGIRSRDDFLSGNFEKSQRRIEHERRKREEDEIYSNLRLRALGKRSEARQNGILCNIDGDYLIELYERQHRRCALTGVEMDVLASHGSNNLSIDRIDPNGGYKKATFSWSTWRANVSKSNMSINDFAEFCKLVLATIGVLLVADFLWLALAGSAANVSASYDIPAPTQYYAEYRLHDASSVPPIVQQAAPKKPKIFILPPGATQPSHTSCFGQAAGSMQCWDNR